MHPENAPGLEVEPRLDRLFGVEMGGGHHPFGDVRADRDRREIEGPQLLRDPRKAVEVPGVAGKVEASRRPGDRPRFRIRLAAGGQPGKRL